MASTDRKPLIVQSDRTLFLEVDHPRHEEVRDRLLPFAELVKSPEHVHTYRITPISLWNAAAAGLKEDAIIGVLRQYSRYDVPAIIEHLIRDQIGRYGRVKLLRDDAGYYLDVGDDILLAQVMNNRKVASFFEGGVFDERKVRLKDYARGHVKSALIRYGIPVEDLAGYIAGAPFDIALRETRLSTGDEFAIRDYQRAAADSFYRAGSAAGGSGVVVLPCGAGKTIVGMAAMAEVGAQTLILVTNITAVHQWKDELLDKTTLTSEDIGEYTGLVKEPRPVTIATYQVLVWRPTKKGPFPHFKLFNERDWGLIVYDEVHLLPAPVFRITAEIQTRRRLGLTATLVREDGKEDEVFSLIGPKRYDTPWKELERKNWIARAICRELRVPMVTEDRLRYAVASNHRRFRVAAENPGKIPAVERLLEVHRGHSILVIGHYLNQLEIIAEAVKAPLITGKTPQGERDVLYEKFRQGTVPVLVVSKVANFALDLPDANVAIQVSGTFGSRQEEAQRLGRILRPKSGENVAYFYTLVSRDTIEQDYALKRELFLTEQGYQYEIAEADAFFARNSVPSSGGDS
ncbi:MAG: DEAD/DEAH box helicase [Candidatus Zixiibacteriota bacterium]|jgi:DNA excision repair protein ERCC-3